MMPSGMFSEFLNIILAFLSISPLYCTIAGVYHRYNMIFLFLVSYSTCVLKYVQHIQHISDKENLSTCNVCGRLEASDTSLLAC